MPVYLREIGFSVLLIGFLEGIAEATAGLSKSYFGKLSDLSGKRLPFVRWGYFLSAISKPMMVVWVFPVWIFFARTLDRLGKGIRTAARDAMLSDEATLSTKGTVFGLHRALDTFGAVIGPTLALIYLYYYPAQYKVLFLFAFLPGMAAIALTYLIRKKEIAKQEVSWSSASFHTFINYWNVSPPAYRKLVSGLLVFTLINSSDVFLLLKVKEAGLDDSSVIGVYIFYNLVYAASAYPMGKLGDRIGFKRTLLLGLTLFSIAYIATAFTDNLYWFAGIFALYGLYSGAVEGVAKAWVSNIADKRDTATAIGTYTGFQSVFSLAASVIAGLTWYALGPGATFLISGITAALVIIYLAVAVSWQPQQG